MQNQNKSLSWQAHEFHHYPKSFGWYVTLISIAILVIAFFIIIEKDIFAAICMGILAFLIFFFSRQLPELTNILLNDKGIYFGHLFYPYKQIKYFWIVNSEHHKTANFHTTAMVNNTLILELEDEDPDMIRNFLLQYLPEHTETEATTIQQIAHKLKF